MTLHVNTLRVLTATLGLAGCLLGGCPSLRAQATSGSAPQTKFDRFISHFDLGISATGDFPSTVSGPVQNSVASNGNLKISPVKAGTVGALATIRAQKSPWVGGEFNFRFAKYYQRFDFTNSQVEPFIAQSTANEYTLGYVVRPDHPLFGLKPFASVGAGTVEFKPTRRGGAGLPVQARAAYYYSVGGDAPLFGDSFGLRVGFRESFYKAPDFLQNYLTINKLQTSLEPTLGLYLHF